MIMFQDEVKTNPILGPSNPAKGAKYRDVAVEFGKKFPIGTVLTMDEFDEFAISGGHIEPPASTEKRSDGWLAFLQRRHQFKTNINKAAVHTAMLDQHGAPPYFVAQIGMGKLEVVTPFKAATATGNSAVMYQLETLTKTKKRKLAHLIQSVDYTTLPVGEQVKVMMLADHISDFEGRINREIGDLDKKFHAVKSSIHHLLQSNQLVPKNGGIKALMAPDDDVEEGDDVEESDS
jgi:hypothetical protein